MAREDLKPLNTRTKEEQKQIAIMGGRASGKARREKKLLKDTLEAMLELTDKKGITKQEQICIALFKKANMGDTKAFEIIRDTIGQKPVEVIQKTEIPIIKDDI